jgi:hypothetical protein
LEIDKKQVKNLRVVIDNEEITGKLIDIGKWERLEIEITGPSKFAAGETAKSGEVFFEYNGKKCFMAGKIYCQAARYLFIKPETGIEIDRRQENRIETPSLPGTVSYKRSIFRKEECRCTIIDLSIHGAKIETRQSLKENVIYSLESSLPYRHYTLPFSAEFKVINSQLRGNGCVMGINFVVISPESKANFDKYLTSIYGKA